MKYSIILPVRNEENNIGKMLKSLHDAPGLKKCNLLIVDGKSSDKTVEIAKSYGARVIVQEKLGISNARNLGWQHAEGQILIFLEADAEVDKNFITNIIKYTQKSKADAWRPNIIPKAHNWIQKALKVQVELATRRQRAETFPTIFRKEVLEKTGGWDESIGIAEDRELPTRIKAAGFKTALIKEAVVFAKPVDSFRALFKEGRWYGRHVLQYFAKTKDFVMLGGLLLYASFVPLTILSLLSKYFTLILALALFVLFVYALKGLVVTKSPYALLIVPVNIVRGFGELVGLLESPFVKQKGKL
jgi:cellulose synthase/poly-beta-1,6-N-acetylglucosamine synthase-like glycosyltransferase